MVPVLLSGRLLLSMADGVPPGLLVLVDFAERRALLEKLALTRQMEALSSLAGGIAHDFNNLLTGILGNASTIRSMTTSDPVLSDLALGGRRVGRDGRADSLSACSPSSGVRHPTESCSRSTSCGGDPPSPGAGDPRLDHHRDRVRPRHRCRFSQTRASSSKRSSTCASTRGTRWSHTLEGHVAPVRRARPHHQTPRRWRRRPGARRGSGLGQRAGRSERPQAAHLRPVLHHKGSGTRHGTGTVVRLQPRGGPRRKHRRSGVHPQGSAVRPSPARATGGQSGDVAVCGDAPPNAPPRRQRHYVLLAEDEDGIRSMVANTLRRQGYDVLVARDGHEALQMWAAHKDSIDLLVLDVRMPYVEGTEVLRQIEPSGRRCLRCCHRASFQKGRGERAARQPRLPAQALPHARAAAGGEPDLAGPVSGDWSTLTPTGNVGSLAAQDTGSHPPVAPAGKVRPRTHPQRGRDAPPAV